MGQGNDGLTQRAAIVRALELIGDRTSLKHLSKAASELYGSAVHVSVCSMWRSHYRKQNNLKTDCRTYHGQPRRDMLNDEHVELKQLDHLRSMIGKPLTYEKAKSLMSVFHSKEHFENTFARLESLQLRVAA